MKKVKTKKRKTELRTLDETRKITKYLEVYRGKFSEAEVKNSLHFIVSLCQSNLDLYYIKGRKQHCKQPKVYCMSGIIRE